MDLIIFLTSCAVQLFSMHRWNRSPVNIYYQAISIMLSFFASFSDTTAKNAWLFTKSILTCYNTKKVSITFFFTKWFACTMPAFTVMLQIGFLTCKREICFSTNITFFFERKCNETSFVLESEQTFDEPPKKYLIPQLRKSHSIKNA